MNWKVYWLSMLAIAVFAAALTVINGESWLGWAVCVTATAVMAAAVAWGTNRLLDRYAGRHDRGGF